jgi:hypothetical protein
LLRVSFDAFAAAGFSLLKMPFIAARLSRHSEMISSIAEMAASRRDAPMSRLRHFLFMRFADTMPPHFTVA